MQIFESDYLSRIFFSSNNVANFEMALDWWECYSGYISRHLNGLPRYIVTFLFVTVFEKKKFKKQILKENLHFKSVDYSIT